LDEIKSYLIKSRQLSDAQLQVLQARFDYMEESATRLGQKDWLNVVIGILVNIATTLALGGDSTRDLFQFAGQIIRQILGTMLYLAGPR
jgi:hypothetical protein